MKVLLILLVIASSSSVMAGKRGPDRLKNFHDVSGKSGVISMIRQAECNSTNLCDGYDGEYCLNNCRSHLKLDLDDFSEIANEAFDFNEFQKVSLKSESPICSRRWLTLSNRSLHALSLLPSLELDCVKFNSTGEPWEQLGSVKELSMSRMELAELPPDFFSNFIPLERLTLSKISISKLTPDFFPDRNRLFMLELTLVHNGLHVIEPKSFKKFNNLEKLHIRNNHLNNLHPEAFYGLDNLVFLDLNRNYITTLGPKAFGTLPRLAHLDLTYNTLNAIEAEAFSGLPLQTLKLSNNKLTELHTAAFKNMTNLTRLDLSDNQLRILSPDMFQELENQDLDLNLTSNYIHQIEPNTFRGFNLRTLELRKNNLTSLEDVSFNGLRIQKWLDIRQNGIEEIQGISFNNLTVAGWIYLDNYAITEVDTDDSEWE